MRLGKPNEHKKRPIKVIMGTKDENKKVMSNLRQLKDTEDDFGRISMMDKLMMGITRLSERRYGNGTKKPKLKTSKDANYTYEVYGNKETV